MTIFFSSFSLFYLTLLLRKIFLSSCCCNNISSHFINLYLCCKYLMILLVCFIRLLPLVERLIHFGWGFQIRLQCLDAPIKLDISAQRSQLSMNFQIASEESLWSDIYDSVCTNSKTAGLYVSSMRDMIAFQIMRVDICKTNWWISLKHR